MSGIVVGLCKEAACLSISLFACFWRSVRLSYFHIQPIFKGLMKRPASDFKIRAGWCSFKKRECSMNQGRRKQCRAAGAEATILGQNNRKIKEFGNFSEGRGAAAPATPVLPAPLVWTRRNGARPGPGLLGRCSELGQAQVLRPGFTLSH